VTANDLPGDRERYLQLGANGYLAKPVDVEHLTQEIRLVRGRS
jgi:CheY-like chemotaxis protein